MADIWNSYLEPHPFEFSLTRETSTSYVARVHQSEPVPLAMSVVFGEWLYNMRSALDYIVWAAAAHASGKLPPPGESGLQYPIYDDEPGWIKNLWRLKPLAEHQREMLATMQPFNSNPDANYLGWINRLARIDRHRRLAVSTARIAEANPVFAIPSKVNPKLEWGQFVLAGGEAQFIRVSFPTEEVANGVTFNPRVGIDPEIEEWSRSTFWGRLKFSERLKMMQVFVAAEVDVYEYDCTGAKSARRTVAKPFRLESDRRRAAGMFPLVTQEAPKPVEWTLGAEGRATTRDKLLGLDFPPHGSGEGGSRSQT